MRSAEPERNDLEPITERDVTLVQYLVALRYGTFDMYIVHRLPSRKLLYTLVQALGLFHVDTDHAQAPATNQVRFAIHIP